MTAKIEIYEVRFNKYKIEHGDTGYSRYVLGMGYDYSDMTITPVKITIIKDRVHVLFSDGGKHTFGVNNDTEFFYRPIKKEKGNVDNGSTT